VRGVQAYEPRAPATVLSPHLDDAVWACFSLLVGDDPLVVATAFAGVPSGTGWWDERCGITDSASHMRDRMAEDRAVLARLGRDAVHLPLLDGQYRDDGLDPAEIVAELGRAVPATSRVYAWAGIGEHPDHELVRDAGLAIAKAGVPITLVTDYCYSTRHGWPTWVSRSPDRPPRTPSGSGRSAPPSATRCGTRGSAGSRPRCPTASSQRCAATSPSTRTSRPRSPAGRRTASPRATPRSAQSKVFYDLGPPA
jgi:hypothetical protein